MSVDIEYFEEHYDSNHPELPDRLWDVLDHLQRRCPVAHSDAPRTSNPAVPGFWLLTRYDDVVSVLQDWQNFTSATERIVELGDKIGVFGHMPPLTSDPPIQRDFRSLLNPFLTPKALAQYEPSIRAMITDLIDGFIEDGHCDLVAQLTRRLPGAIILRLVFGIDDDEEFHRLLWLTDKVIYDLGSPDVASAMTELLHWADQFAEARRTEPRQDGIIDSLLHGSVDGRPLTRDEVSGAIKILILGGFITQTHATTSTMLALAEDPDLQDNLRRNPDLIPTIFDEILRLEPPVMHDARWCTRDVVMGGQTIKAGDQVVVHLGAANRDPSQFERPNEMDVDRKANRHLAFGAGAHRCIGSNLARLGMRVLFEEILSRMHDIRITDGDAPRRAPATAIWGLEYLPLTFTAATTRG